MKVSPLTWVMGSSVAVRWVVESVGREMEGKGKEEGVEVKGKEGEGIMASANKEDSHRALLWLTV